MLLLVTLAFARDVDLKVHDMKGVVTGELTVELGEPGREPLRFVCRDDGVAPDAIAGDRLYTARAEGLALDHGAVVVRAGERTWQGGFRFEEGSDPVLLIGLEDGGFAAASTREVMFVPQDRMGAGGPGVPGGQNGGAPGGTPGVAGTPGGAPGGVAGPGASEAGMARKAPTRAGLPEGMWLGWGVAALALAGLGALVWAGSARPPRVPPLVGPAPATAASRGPWAPAPDRTDLFVGEAARVGVAGGARGGGPSEARGGGPSEARGGEPLSVGEGRWTPEEIALAALRVRGPVRVVVTDASRVEAEGDAYAALAAALVGVADLLWVEGA